MQIELRDANTLIKKWHRHSGPVAGHKFSLCAVDEKHCCIVGVCVVGRPVARWTDHRKVIEVTRLATDGTKNACSILYAAAARIARDFGYERIQTFILEEELGTALDASGWEYEGKSIGRGRWNFRPGRTENKQAKKKRYYKALNKPIGCDLDQIIAELRRDPHEDAQYSLF